MRILILPLCLLLLQGCATVNYSYNKERWERPKVSWQDTYDNIKRNQYYRNNQK